MPKSMYHTYRYEDLTDEQFDAYNASIAGALAESWYFDTIESWNSSAVSGGEWAICWLPH